MPQSNRAKRNPRCRRPPPPHCAHASSTHRTQHGLHLSYTLFRQSYMYYESLPVMRPEWIPPLVAKFAELLRQHRVFRAVFGPI